jgi:hypothetical protein
VLSWDEDTQSVRLNRVIGLRQSLSRDLVEVYLAGVATPIISTPRHPYYVEGRGYVQAQLLARGDHLRSKDPGSEIFVASVRSLTGADSTPVYNLIVENAHNYFVAERAVLVHNVCEPINPFRPEILLAK